MCNFFKGLLTKTLNFYKKQRKKDLERTEKTEPRRERLRKEVLSLLLL